MLTGCIFGAFHGSIWRFLPTAILGMAMAYLLTETGNMVYNMLFHAVNNLLPLVLLFGLQWVTEWVYSTDEAATYTQTSAGGQVYSLAALGINLERRGNDEQTNKTIKTVPWCDCTASDRGLRLCGRAGS